MTDIETLLDKLLDREGGYVNNPADRGGATNFGITEQTARAFGFAGDMRSLPREAAKAIYRRQYWTRPGFDQVAVRYPALAAELFDTGVNMGPKTAATFLQRALNVLNRGASDYPDINVDGDVGELALHALDGFRGRRGAAGETVLLKAVECLQGARYIAIAESNPSQETFEYGWLDNRVGGHA
jgi:lysozyme family protein